MGDDLAHVPEVCDKARGAKLILLALIFHLGRPAAAVGAHGVDTPARLLLQRTAAAAYGAVLKLDIFKNVHTFLLK